MAAGQLALVGYGWARPRTAIPVVAALAPLLAPHALYYDAGMGLVALWVATDRDGRQILGRAGVVWAAGLLAALPGPWTAAASVGAAWLAGRSRDSDDGR
jgi:hypothetical protein